MPCRSNLYRFAFIPTSLNPCHFSQITVQDNRVRRSVIYLRFPASHHRRIRTTNRLEWLTGEGRQGTKVIPRFPTERSYLELLYASLVTASKRWYGVTMTPVAMKQLQQLRAETATSSPVQEAVDCCGEEDIQCLRLLQEEWDLTPKAADVSPWYGV